MSSNIKRKILFIADHASNHIPVSLQNLGLSKNLLSSHIAYDLGIRELCVSLSNALGSKYIVGEYSRLVIDLNRGKSDPTLIPEIVDKKLVTRNINLSNIDKRERVTKIYDEYHKRIKKIIKKENIKILISLHSFNPIFKNKKRNIHFGILSNQDRKLSEHMLNEMRRRKLKVGDNEPYKGNLIGDTMYSHGLKNNLPHTLIEIRNDLLSTPVKINRISATLKKVIVKSIDRI